MLGRLTAKISFCGRVGAFSGFFVAAFFEWFNHNVSMHTPQDLLVVGLVSWGVVMLLCWGFFGAMVRYGWAQIARVTFFITLFTTALVFYVLTLVTSPFSLLIGFLTGMIIGVIITKLCELVRSKRRKSCV